MVDRLCRGRTDRRSGPMKGGRRNDYSIRAELYRGGAPDRALASRTGVPGRPETAGGKIGQRPRDHFFAGQRRWRGSPGWLTCGRLNDTWRPGDWRRPQLIT